MPFSAVNDPERECGVASVAARPPGGEQATPRITGGATSRAGAHPWQATVRVRGRDASYHWCGAVVVSRNHVLTAAHCLREFPLSTYLVRVGDFSLGESGSDSTLLLKSAHYLSLNCCEYWNPMINIQHAYRVTCQV